MPSLLKPLRFRFTNETDSGTYGNAWHVYDEAALTALPARTLMSYEQMIGVPIADVMNGVRQSSAFGDMAGSWLALVIDGSDPGPFGDYNPIVMQIEWEPVPAEDLEPGKEGTAPAVQPEPVSAPPTTTEMAASDVDPGPVVSDSPGTLPTDTVSLQSLPISE